MEITLNELIIILFKIRDRMTQDFLAQSQPVGELEEKQVAKTIPEFMSDPYSQLERQALVLRWAEPGADGPTLSRYKSSESLGGLSPPAKGRC